MFKKLLLLFLSVITTLSSQENQVANLSPQNAVVNLSGEPSAIIAGCVNSISGDYLESHTDLVLPAPYPLAIQRVYASSMNEGFGLLKGWMFNYSGFLFAEKSSYDDEIIKAIVRDAECSTLTFEPREKGGRYDPFELSSLYNSGLSNTSKGVISGRTNPKNIKVALNKLNDGSFRVKTGAGETYDYDRKPREFAGEEVRRLLKIKKANRLNVVYEYDKHDLSEIKLLNRAGNLLGNISFEYPKCSKKKPHLVLKASDGRVLNYKFLPGDTGGGRLEVSSNFSPTQFFYYYQNRLISRDLPEDRYKNICYYKKGDWQVGPQRVHIKSDSDAINRVHFIEEPVGVDKTPIKTYSFVYDFHFFKDKKGRPTKEVCTWTGRTTVYDAYNHKTVYAYKLENLAAIEKYEGTSPYKLYSKEQVYWGKEGSRDISILNSRTLSDGVGTPVFCRHYNYDKAGNVHRDNMMGNLTGNNCHPIVVDEKGIPQANGCETYSVVYDYTKDGFNLVSSETHTSHDIVYQYKEESNYLIKKYIRDAGGIRLRHFYDHDVHGALCREVVDDGCEQDQKNLKGVTQRKITTIQNTSSDPKGLPEVIEEKYLDLDTMAEVLVHKTVNTYDPQGRWIRQEHYDSSNTLAYVLERKYDSMGNLEFETNPLGQATKRKFDLNGNIIQEQGPCPDYYMVFNYDFANRMISKKQVCASQECFIETYRYDYKGNKVAATDIYGNETLFVYNAFNQLIKTVYPRVLNENGQPCYPETNQSYDLMGYVTMSTDLRGHATYTDNTIRGKPYCIRYPDGSIEQFEYSLKGDLVKSTAKDGAYTFYGYDYQSRPTSIKVYDPAGTLLSATSRTYSAFHLLSETDSAGHVTTYNYDFAGRLSSICKGESRVDYFYDTLGRQEEIRTWYGHNSGEFIRQMKKYDLLNRVVEEYELVDDNIHNKVSYTYDERGNRTNVTTYSNAGKAVAATHYDARGQVIRQFDALGHETRTTYRYDYVNALGQRVPYKEICDPLGRRAVSIQDALGREAIVMRLDPFGRTIQKTTYFFDEDGNRSIIYGQIFHALLLASMIHN